MKKQYLLVISIVILVLIVVYAIINKIEWLVVFGLLELLIIAITNILQNRQNITVSKNKLSRKYDKKNLNDHFITFIELSNLTTYSQYYDITLSDKILKQVYIRLKHVVGQAVYIYGTNQIIIISEFENKTVINKELRETEQQIFAEELKQYIETNKYLNEKTGELFEVSLTIGVSSFGMFCEIRDIDALIKLAHFTMLKAKDINQSILVANDEIRLIKQDLDSFNHEIEHGFKLDEFSPYFLPIIDTTTLKIIGCESLVRWRKNKYRIIEASKFKDIAIEKNLFDKIDKRVIEKTFKAYSHWLQKGLIDSDFTITINLSMQTIIELDANELLQMASEYNIPTDCIEFDISENIILTTNLEQQLSKLTEVGFKVSMDAFGLHQFSLQSFSKLPITTLKLDRMNLPSSKPTQSEYKIYEALVQLSRIMNYKVLSKGVENKYQLELVKQLNVDFVQGYYFTPPLDESKIVIFLNKYKNGIPV